MGDDTTTDGNYGASCEHSQLEDMLCSSSFALRLVKPKLDMLGPSGWSSSPYN